MPRAAHRRPRQRGMLRLGAMPTDAGRPRTSAALFDRLPARPRRRRAEDGRLRAHRAEPGGTQPASRGTHGERDLHHRRPPAGGGAARRRPGRVAPRPCRGQVAQNAAAANLKNAAPCATAPRRARLVLFTEDLMRGYRVDVQPQTGETDPRWYSLCRRTGDLPLGRHPDQPIELPPDEGHVNGASTPAASPATAGDDHYLHESAVPLDRLEPGGAAPRPHDPLARRCGRQRRAGRAVERRDRRVGRQAATASRRASRRARQPAQAALRPGATACARASSTWPATASARTTAPSTARQTAASP